MKNNYKVIGIAGPAGCGKDTAADHILERLPFGYTKASFADPIKQMARGLGLTHDQLYGNLKDTVDEDLGCTPRKILQTLGTEWGREIIHPNIWVRAMFIKVQNLEQGAGFVMPDVRFANEANFVRQNGKLIHIVGRTKDVEDHVSENGVEILPEDIVIRNEDLIDTFYDYINEAIKYL